MLHLVGTNFGFVVVWPGKCDINSSPSTLNASFFLTMTDHDLHLSIQKFWQKEERPALTKYHAEEQQFDEPFATTHAHEPGVTQVQEESKSTPLSVLVATSTLPSEWDLLCKFSSWMSLKYVMAFILRFVYNCRHRNRRSGPLRGEDLNSSEMKIVKLVQSPAFAHDINSPTNIPINFSLKIMSDFNRLVL